MEGAFHSMIQPVKRKYEKRKGIIKDLVLYDQRWWGLDHLFWAYWKLFIKDILLLKTFPFAPEYFRYLNHPVLKVQILGFIVSVDNTSKYVAYKVDDGTALIRCVHWRSPKGFKKPEPATGLELGTLALLKGKLNTYMEQRQVNVYSIKEVKDCNCESFWWLDICSLKATVYRIPLLLSSNLEENTSYKDPVNLSEYLDNRNKLVAKKEVKPSSPEEICYDLIKAFAIQKKEFSFAELKESALPVCLAAFEERNFSNVECCTHQMFVGLIQRLVSEGLVFLRDAEKDIYEVVSTEFIVDFMKRTFKFYGPTLLLGDLLQYCKRDNRSLKHVSQKRFFEALSLLLDESEIVEVSKDCYRLFGEIMTEL